MLLHLRARAVAEDPHRVERTAMRGLAGVFGSARRYERAQRVARRLQGLARRLPGPLAVWLETRELPRVPEETFREWWSRERGA